MKPYKQQVNYRYHEQCCGTCKYSYKNSYDDNVCPQLRPEECVIDIGGLCDLWEPEQ